MPNAACETHCRRSPASSSVGIPSLGCRRRVEQLGDKTVIKPRADGGRLAWIDIDYPPQVQYLLPFKHTLEQRGYTVVVTARDIGLSQELLCDANVPFEAVGGSLGAQRWRKIAGT